MNEKTAELIGALIGDGHIYRKFNKYRIGFTGHPVTDKEYFDYLKNLILVEWKKDAKIVDRGNGIQMIINSKETCLQLINELGIPCGKDKTVSARIPSQIECDWNLARKFIRGLTDTDGTVFAVRKPGVEKYPSIEITTINLGLAEQVRILLEGRGFRVSKIWKFKQTMSNRSCYRFGLNGQNNLKLWIKEVGFSNPYKMGRALSYIR